MRSQQDQSDLATRLIPDSEEILTLAEESRSKLNKDIVNHLATRNLSTSESLEDELDELESDKAEFSNMYDMLLQECVSKDVMCSYLQTSSDLDEITELQCLYLHKVMECVAHKTNVSRPQTRSNQMKDKVVPYTSHAKLKKTEIGKSSYSLLDSGMHQAYEGKCNTVVQVLLRIYSETTSSKPPICLLAKASPTQAWLWHRRLSHLNFDTINLLLKKDIVNGLPKLKYVKDQLCSSCEVSKAKRSSFKSKTVPSSKGRLNLLYMDLCGPMRVASINGKKYILVIVDDYSRYTWTLFLRSKDETPEVLKDFLTMIHEIFAQ
ncbi:retrovirus-related pol polyprotein from transposon TNT 1-94 [Tanacetum coccineum]